MADSRRPAANLVLATCAFALCFTAWSLIAPFAKTFKRMFGVAPGKFRRLARHAESPFRAMGAMRAAA